MINHFRNRGGALDFVDTKALIAEKDKGWDPSEVPKIYFNRVKKAIKHLTRAGILLDLKERTDMTLCYVKSSREFYMAVREWKAKPVAIKTWANIKVFVCTEHACEENKVNLLQNSLDSLARPNISTCKITVSTDTSFYIK
jgi:hypothetical protein